MTKTPGKVDFSRLLDKPAGLASKPPTLPPGDYPAMIKSFETGEAQNENRTPYVRFNIQLRGWPEGIEEEDKKNEKGEVIDLAKKPMRINYYLTDEALYRLDEMLISLGIDMEGKKYREIFPELNGMMVTADVKQLISDRSGDPYNTVEKIGPEA